MNEADTNPYILNLCWSCTPHIDAANDVRPKPSFMFISKPGALSETEVNYLILEKSLCPYRLFFIQKSLQYKKTMALPRAKI